jgi:hypothetical protein
MELRSHLSNPARTAKDAQVLSTIKIAAFPIILSLTVSLPISKPNFAKVPTLSLHAFWENPYFFIKASHLAIKTA